MREERERREAFTRWLRESIAASARPSAPVAPRPAARAPQPRPAPAPAVRTLSAAEREALRREGAERARLRMAEIAKLCAEHGVPELFPALVAEEGMTLERARVRVWAASSGRGEPFALEGLDPAELELWSRAREARTIQAVERIVAEAQR
jgi:hypothetical protein